VIRTPSTAIVDATLRVVLTGAHQLIRLRKSLRRPRTFGAHAVALTPERKIIFVKLRYALGWRLPGGGRSEDEDAGDAVLRELREEIGMTAHGRVRPAGEFDASARDLASVLIVEDVRYRPPRWSWEIEAICEAAVDDLPAGLSPRMRHWLHALRHAI
jgi:8-oxo-dGTP pyrophosphatase MutT (NUDIX family)